MATPYEADDAFATVGEIFDDATNPSRKALRDPRGHARGDRRGRQPPRAAADAHAETVVVWDAFIEGHGVSVIGVESKPLPRAGRVPVDGPETWTGGTLFPRSSKKLSRAINAASGRRPRDPREPERLRRQPQSLRELRLERRGDWSRGRELQRANHLRRRRSLPRHAYVVFSKALNPSIRAMALHGTYVRYRQRAAAAVVFPREVRKRAETTHRCLRRARASTRRPRSRNPACVRSWMSSSPRWCSSSRVSWRRSSTPSSRRPGRLCGLARGGHRARGSALADHH